MAWFGMIQEWQKAYIAGYFDGDGSVNGYIMKSGSHEGEIRIAASITSVNPVPINIMCEWLGCMEHKVYGPYKQKRKKPYRDSYRFRLSTQKQIIEFLELILPYLITRRKQAKLMIKYCKSRLSKDNILFDYWKNDRSYRIPQRPPYTEEEKNFIHQISELNY